MLAWLPATIDRDAPYKEIEGELADATAEVVGDRDVKLKRRH